jgi:hypothetical protein
MTEKKVVCIGSDLKKKKSPRIAQQRVSWEGDIFTPFPNQRCAKTKSLKEGGKKKGFYSQTLENRSSFPPNPPPPRLPVP